MKAKPTHPITLAVVLSRGVISRWMGCLATVQSPSTGLGSVEPGNDESKSRLLARHGMVGSIPEQIRSAFTWRDAAKRGLALIDKYPDKFSEKEQRDRLRRVLTKVLQEDTKDAYMFWEDFRNIDGSKPLPNPWLQAMVRHLRHVLRLRNLFGPEISDDNLLAAFSRWDENIARTLRNVNQVVMAAQPVDGVTVGLPPLWRIVFSYLAGLIAADQQILSCYRRYWEALPWRDNVQSAVFAAKTETPGKIVL
jgi:hypothetical protein